MLVTKDLDNMVFDYIYPCGENLAYIAWTIRDFYHHTIMATKDQSVFGRDMILNTPSVLDRRFITIANQQQVDIDKSQGNDRRVTHDYATGDQVYVEMTGISRRINYNKQGTYIIKAVFTKSTV